MAVDGSGVLLVTDTVALIVPKDFSAALASPGKFEPRQAQLRLVTNDTNNYLVGTIALIALWRFGG